MEAINIDDPQANLRSDAVGVKDNRLVVTALPLDYGTFAVSTNEDFNRLPYRRARSFRIHNITGKLVGARLRHETIVSDDFEDGLSRWSGTADMGFSTDDLEGAKTMLVRDGYAYAPLGGTELKDTSIIEIVFRSRHEAKIGIFDDAANVSLIEGMETGVTIGFEDDGSTVMPNGGGTATWVKGVEYRLEIEVVPSTQKFNAHLYTGKTREEITQNTSTTMSGGILPDATMANHLIAISGEWVEVDSINIRRVPLSPYSNEIMTTGASYVYPCERSISEYEIANLGSDAQNYTDNTDSITLTGFHAV